MEGLVDEILRDVLTRMGGVDWCVTEFIRVSDRLLPQSSFGKLAPELKNGALTRAGTPVRVQLLGSDPICLADNAAFACTLGAPAIDLNFGCPAKTVNKSRGGAVLLKEPELLHAILCEVRRAVPAHIPVTAKMRLGFDSPDGALDCARALVAGGQSSWWCTHERRSKATSRLRIGSGSRGCRRLCRCPSMPMAISGRWRTGAAAVRSAGQRTSCWGAGWFHVRTGPADRCG